ncbi:MAG: DUF692 domain-containing protein [Deltaproteobacteria bacterium]|nr:DUF692 domain-containing protein [Deltaproteobacteria bacterium]
MTERRALGVGLRPELYEPLRARLSRGGARPLVGFVEALAENFLGAPRALRRLDALAALAPVALHCVSLNLCGADPLDGARLAALAALARRVRAPYVSDHLCWTSLGALHHHDLLPPPCEAALAPYVAARARAAQGALGVPFGLENVSSYLRWPPREGGEALSEAAFYARVVEGAGAHYMLDLNNLYVSSHNLGFDPEEVLAVVDWGRVLQVHVAGHQRHPSGLLHDTHDRPVCDEVWALYRAAWRRGGPFPTLLEWDADLPPFEALEDTLARAVEARGGW